MYITDLFNDFHNYNYINQKNTQQKVKCNWFTYTGTHSQHIKYYMLYII